MKSNAASFQSDLTKRPWPYDFYSNGDKISPGHRMFYRKNRHLHTRFPNPFDTTTQPSYFQHTSGIKSDTSVSELRHTM